MGERMNPVPLLHSMVVCDQCIREEGTGKYSLIGVFTHIHAPAFPALHPGLFIYFCLAGGLGQYAIGLEIRRLSETSDVIFSNHDCRLTINNRLATCEYAFKLTQVRFDQPGKYDLVILADGIELGRKPLWVVPLVQKGNHVQ